MITSFPEIMTIGETAKYYEFLNLPLQTGSRWENPLSKSGNLGGFDGKQ